MSESPADIPIDRACPIERRARDRGDRREQVHRDAIFSLARISEVHDSDTGEHVLRIRAIVECIALELGFPADDAASLGDDAILHDLGKLRVPVDVLKKPDSFTEHERHVMRSHTIRGERMLGGLEGMKRAAKIARCHHERWDGSGYPDGLKGEEIPIEARITAAADVLDALIATRCYKQAWTYGSAVEEVIALAGTHLDPHVVEAIKRADARGVLCAVFNLPKQCSRR